MKLLFLTTFFITSVIGYSQIKERDLRLVGTWQGSEKGNQEEGMSRYWVQQRFNDGTFLMLFVTIDKDGEGSSLVDKGEWWTEGGKFYEIHFNTKLTDTYFYEVLDDQHVKFRLDSTNLEFNNSNYEFIDTKLIEGLDYQDSEK